VLASLVASPPAWAAPDGPDLLLRGAEGFATPAPLLEVDYVLHVTGVVARATVTQRFRNPSDRWLEGVYRFPLPESAAVDGLRMRIGERVVEGEIREREAARRTYERARDAGQRATLVEQQRPDVFHSRVANVGPGVEVEVEIDFQWTLDVDSGGVSLRLPWIVAPRFGDGEADGTTLAAAAADTTLAATAAAGAPPEVAFAIDLDPGFPLAAIESPTHALATEQLDWHRWLVTLAEDGAPADRDFVLRWRPTPGDAPRAALFHETHDGDDYALLLLMPPEAAAPTRRAAREIVFVVDTSGSMGGASIEQARRAVAMALGRLTPLDRFNVVAFASQTRALFPGPVPADPRAVERAVAWVEALRADGGTVMLPALARALRDDGDGPGLRQVVFVTDGCVGNERELFAYVREHLGRSRLFTVGIGSAPNGHFMEGAARLGRGSRVDIASPDEVGARMAALFAKLERPALTDVEIHWNDAVEAWPARVPDLYVGEPVLVTARIERWIGEVVVSGRLGDAPWEARLPLAPGRPGRGIEKLFGRRKIAARMDGLIAGEDPERVREAVVEVALAHGLVSRWTSLVAVERTPLRPRHEGLDAGAVATGLPAGFVLPATATPAPWLASVALASAALAALLLAASRAVPGRGRRP
jgi:Ca-activated chloride channel family protein